MPMHGAVQERPDRVDRRAARGKDRDDQDQVARRRRARRPVPIFASSSGSRRALPAGARSRTAAARRGC